MKDKQALLGADKHANQHRLSRLFRLKSDMKQQTSFSKKCYSPLECYF
ncbi:hypothetical protein AA440_003789 [Salmonella enterica subsp. enterica]|nr:hypothetical protein [Salmonella enterica subsp. enterica]